MKAPGIMGEPERYPGSAVASEPRAAVVAREILAAGGSAADAAAALGLALAVTRPDVAGLGAGGVCLVADQPGKRVRALEFVAPPKASPDGRAVAPPGLVAGMAVLHAAHGKLRWAQVVAPAEGLARFGLPLSRGTARVLAAAAEVVLADPEARQLFAPDGAALAEEGTRVVQPDLADILTAVRIEGPAELYRGALAQRFVAAVRAAGGVLDEQEMAAFRPQLRDTLAVRIGNNNFHFSPAAGSAGAYQAMLAALLDRGDRFVDARPDERPHLLADAAQRARAAALETAPERRRVDSLLAGYRRDGRTAPAAPARFVDGSGTGFVVADGDGSAVACAVSLGRPFGLGRMAPGTGIFPAVPLPPGGEAAALSPLLVVNRATSVFFLAAAGAGLGAPTAIAAIGVEAVEGGRPIDRVVEAARLHHAGQPDEVLVQSGTPPAITAALSARGYAVRDGGPVAVVEVIACSDGLPRSPETCVARADGRGLGLAVLGPDPAVRRR